MAKVKIKSSNSKDPRIKNSLLEILSRNDIYATRLISIPDGFVVLTWNEQDLDKIFNSTTNVQLEEEGLTPIIPLELKANRSVIILNVDTHIYSNNESDIMEEIMNKNDWAKENITNLVKFPNSQILKITFKQSSQAKKAQTAGLRLFSMSIPATQIKQEVYHNIQTCFRCYALEDHFSSQCPKPKDYKVCSECAQEGHTWKECSSNEKKCLNCEENHRTLAAKCSKRKTILTNKRQNDNTNMTYSQVTKQVPDTSIPTMSNEAHLKIFTCMLHAHFQNMAEPGTYETELNNLLRANKLPPIKIPKNPASSKIIARMTESKQEEDKEISDLEQEEEQRVRRGRSKTRTDTPRHQNVARPTTPNEANQPETAEDIGLKIIMTNKSILPTRDPHIEHIIKQVNNGEYKWTYTDRRYDEDLVASLITKQKLKITKDSLKKVDEGTFRRIRNGLNIRSPPENQKQSKKTC